MGCVSGTHRMELDQRGHGKDYERFDIPIARHGGIADLLAEAESPGRRFDVVICENVARVARRAYEGLSLERELERAGVPLFASNEPITLTGSRAQRILQRRINQSIAEYEVLNTLEQSWGGLCTHVREGWNIGKPCYGYRAKTFRHPNPMKATKGQTKTRLDPDGNRGETVPRSRCGATTRTSATTPSPSASTPTPPRTRPPSPPARNAPAAPGARPASQRSCATPSTPATKCSTAARRAPERASGPYPIL